MDKVVHKGNTKFDYEILAATTVEKNVFKRKQRKKKGGGGVECFGWRWTIRNGTAGKKAPPETPSHCPLFSLKKQEKGRSFSSSFLPPFCDSIKCTDLKTKRFKL